MEGINRALKNQDLSQFRRFSEGVSNSNVPCVFVSYQREDEGYASDVANYIISKQIDVYFDLEDNDLKIQNQTRNPKAVTTAIRKGLNNSEYMLVIVSPNTSKSPWVPFEVGYSYDDKGDKMKLLRHKGILKSALPDYLKVKDLLSGTASLNGFLDSIRKRNDIYENLSKAHKIKNFSEYNVNPLSKYLDNE